MAACASPTPTGTIDLMNMLDRIDQNASPEALRRALSDGWGVDLDRVHAEVEERGLGASVPWVACGEPELANGEYWLQPPTSRHTLWFDDAEPQLADHEARVSLRALSGAFEATRDDRNGFEPCDRRRP